MKIHMRVKKDRLIIAIFFIAVISLSFVVDTYLSHALSASAIFLVLLNRIDNKSSPHVMLFVGFTIFIYLPALLNSYFRGTSFVLFYITAVLSILYIIVAENCVFKPVMGENRNYMILFASFATFMILASFQKIQVIYVLSPFVMFFAMSLKPGRILHNVFLVIVFSGVLFFYMNFGWNGFGRTVIFAALLTGYLYFMYANNFPVSKLFLAFASTLVALVSVGRKSLDFSDINVDSILSDSAFGPYRLASEFIEYYHYNGMDFKGFLDQVLFTGFSFIPRELWPSKPFGFGFQFTVENLDQYLVDAGHSIASTLVGDHIYYLGYWGILTGVVLVYVVAKLTVFCYKLKFLQGYTVVLIATNIMVLVWGGMTSFSARIVHPLLIMMPMFMLYIIYCRVFSSYRFRS